MNSKEDLGEHSSICEYETKERIQEVILTVSINVNIFLDTKSISKSKYIHQEGGSHDSPLLPCFLIPVARIGIEGSRALSFSNHLLALNSLSE